jgi:hypothetical protein
VSDERSKQKRVIDWFDWRDFTTKVKKDDLLRAEKKTLRTAA